MKRFFRFILFLALLAVGWHIYQNEIVPREKVFELAATQIPAWIDQKIIKVDGDSRRGVYLEGVRDIVIHYVGNPGTTAQQNRDYYANSSSEVSSHFVIGLKGEIIQCIPLHEKSSASNHRNKDKGIRLSSIPHNEYPFNIPAVRHLKKTGGITLDKPVTFFVGENGTGKSTLIEAIAVAMGFNAEGGSRDFYFNTRKTHSDLYEHLQIIKSVRPYDGFFLRAESFYNTASYLEENSTLLRYGGVSFHEQSHGESFLSLVINRFDGNGLYILDEPEAALSPQRLMSLLVAIDELVKANSQFIIATHSPILMAYPNAEILQFTEDGIDKVSYRETEHYKITKQFIDTPERMIKYLLSEK